MTAVDPSLPQRAGRALKKLETARALRTAAIQARLAQPVAADKPKRKHKSAERRITVKSLVHPEPNMDKMAKALLALAREMAAADRAKKGGGDTGRLREIADEINDDVDHDSAA